MGVGNTTYKAGVVVTYETVFWVELVDFVLDGFSLLCIAPLLLHRPTKIAGLATAEEAALTGLVIEAEVKAMVAAAAHVVMAATAREAGLLLVAGAASRATATSTCPVAEAVVACGLCPCLT
jgi:hypothetical protein